MVKHVILWTLKDELSAEEKVSVKQGIKEGLEALKGKVPGIVEIKVNINAAGPKATGKWNACSIAT